MFVLVINAGSSSIKYQFIDPANHSILCSGLLERIGIDNGMITHKVFKNGREERLVRESDFPDHASGMKMIASVLTDKTFGVIDNPEEVKAIGHRVVHGGEEYTEPVVITEKVKENIRRLSPLVPLHNPANLMAIEMAEKIFRSARQVAVFDTAFHQTLPPRAFRFAIPNAFYEKNGIRVFGFHGISHQYVSEIAAQRLGKKEARIITIHLGNGCSITAVKNGKSIDTSMGLGALDGLIMGTRSGTLDPTVIFYLIDTLGYSPDEVRSILNKESGLKGLSGSSDMRDVEAAVRQNDQHAILAMEMYAYRIKKFIGAYTAVMNGLDALVFTAGVGENDATIRRMVCEDMDFLGIYPDLEKNRLPSPEPREINTSASPVKIFVIPTNEELKIAADTMSILSDPH